MLLNDRSFISGTGTRGTRGTRENGNTGTQEHRNTGNTGNTGTREYGNTGNTGTQEHRNTGTRGIREHGNTGNTGTRGTREHGNTGTRGTRVSARLARRRQHYCSGQISKSDIPDSGDGVISKQRRTGVRTEALVWTGCISHRRGESITRWAGLTVAGARPNWTERLGVVLYR